MAHDSPRSKRDAALRAVLVQRANHSRPSGRSSFGGSGETASRHLPLVATIIVLAGVVALSAATIAAGQSRITAASSSLASPASSNSEQVGPSQTPTPTNIYSGPLIAMDGARSLTRAQLHALTPLDPDDPADSAVGEQQDWLDIQCMAEQGYLYDPTFDGSQGLELGKTWGLTPKQLEGYRTALWGLNLNSSKPYDWRTAGCHGRSVHLTGQDDNH